MIKQIVTCDKCKKEVVIDSYCNSKYKGIKVGFSDGYNTKAFEICPSCQEALGLIEKDGTEISMQLLSSADKLFEIIEEIVTEQIGNRG